MSNQNNLSQLFKTYITDHTNLLPKEVEEIVTKERFIIRRKTDREPVSLPERTGVSLERFIDELKSLVNTRNVNVLYADQDEISIRVEAGLHTLLVRQENLMTLQLYLNRYKVEGYPSTIVSIALKEVLK